MLDDVVEQLETSGGLVLRPWAQDDVGAVLEAFAAPDMAGQSREPITTRQAATSWIADVEAAWDRGHGATWAVVDVAGSVLGSVSVAAIDHHHDTGWVSYFTLPAARGRGVASAGVRAVAAWAFTERDLHRLELGHRTNNPASCRVATAAGFAVEGLEREKLRYGEQRFDVELHARLATDPAPRDRQLTRARRSPARSTAPR